MIQFAKPRRTLVGTDQFRRHEISAKELFNNALTPDGELLFVAVAFMARLLGDGLTFVISLTADSRRSGTPNRFDPSYYRTHDPLAYIPSDAQSAKSQPSYSSGLPTFSHPGSFTNGLQRERANGAPKRAPYGGGGGSTVGGGGYASSIISQDIGAGTTDSGSVLGGPGSVVGGPAHLSYSQADRLRRRLSQSSFAGASDLGSALSGVDYKSQDSAVDEDLRSQYGQSNSGFTEF